MSDAFWTATFIALSTIIVAWIQSRANKQLKAIHTLVNSATGAQLKLNAELSRWKAGQTNSAADIEAADKAEKLYREHEQKEAAVDKQ